MKESGELFSLTCVASHCYVSLPNAEKRSVGKLVLGIGLLSPILKNRAEIRFHSNFCTNRNLLLECCDHFESHLSVVNFTRCNTDCLCGRILAVEASHSIRFVAIKTMGLSFPTSVFQLCNSTFTMIKCVYKNI